MMTKRKGEIGYLCLIPLEGWKGVKGEPFTRMEKNAPDTLHDPFDTIFEETKHSQNLSHVIPTNLVKGFGHV